MYIHKALENKFLFVKYIVNNNLYNYVSTMMDCLLPPLTPIGVTCTPKIESIVHWPRQI